MRLTVKLVADRELADSAMRVGRGVARAGDRVAVRAGRRRAEHAAHRGLDRLGDDVLPLAGLVMRFGPREPEDVGEEALGEAMPPHDLLGERATLGGERIFPSISTRPSCSRRLIISDTAGREMPMRSAMRAWMTSTSSSASS